MKNTITILNLALLFITINSCNLFKEKKSKDLSETNELNKSIDISVTSKENNSKGISISSQWIISRFDENENSAPEINKSSIITINEKEGSFHGNGGCNSISGKVKIEGNSIKFSNMISTEMYCDNMPQETKFINSLENAETFKIEGCEMHLFQKNKRIMTLESCR